MTLFLSVPEALSQHPQAEQTRSIRQPWTIPLIDAAGKSQGYRQSVDLRPGLNVLIDDYTLQDDLVVDYGEDEPCDPYQYLESSFMLSGHNRREEIQPAHNFFLAKWRCSDGCQVHWQAGERVLKFDIHINADLFETFVGEQFDALPPLLRQIAQNPQPSQHRFRHVQPTTTAMQSAIHQILHCPYQGLTRWLYLEGKVIELIALRLDQIREAPEARALLCMTGDRRDRLYQARDILLSRLDNPPSVLELAREVGLNHNKLKQGFRQVFGTTVFGYSQLCRLEKARQLLYEGHLTVAAVASEVGYANAAKFASAFKRKFGITPSACRSGEKLR
ncbi:helix-turn-helix transcriptional regulator [Romeria aff. gracilis LEGE 07310]|uniref:Helix-turn-helix transcriptional regulator n=1 Tax=Vasconcelosia minhoensis LEGE 07310 TaxID=915328 RepID=A0A8J7DC50_9CYAN|nr:AraC family transcriptional regulator [Romeria gracilis]MBE9077288.1 helix-turn-helix transcriptional regulator [Romeria aff. gracilis LEGE 07310]